MSIKIIPQKLLFVVSAPSGAGKSSIVKTVVQNMPGLDFSISSTTRPPRKDEKDGVNYNFLSRDEFQKKISDGDFLEYAQVYNEFYGTRGDIVDGILRKGKDVIMDVDVQGALNIKNQRDDAVLIYIFPPSLQDLHKRLVLRDKDSPEEIERRVNCARDEMKHAGKYHYAIINNDFHRAVEELSSIIRAERGCVERLKIELD